MEKRPAPVSVTVTATAVDHWVIWILAAPAALVSRDRREEERQAAVYSRLCVPSNKCGKRENNDDE
eukprot:scaffold45584_cov39-Attheya_sp.AAC.1